jgi:hypothetical protein
VCSQIDDLRTQSLQVLYSVSHLYDHVLKILDAPIISTVSLSIHKRALSYRCQKVLVVWTFAMETLDATQLRMEKKEKSFLAPGDKMSMYYFPLQTYFIP